MTAIRKHFKDFIAVIGLILIAAGVSAYILSKQRMRFPIIQDKPYVLKAEFQTAQAVIAGQGQTVRVAGVRIGDIGAVELKDGRAIVRMDIDPQVRGHGPHGRDRAAASQDRPEGHVHPARPGRGRRARGEGELDDPGRLHAARRQPGRDPLARWTPTRATTCGC